MNKKIAFVAYESPYAPGGGIAAVLKHLPAALKKASKLPTYVITPFHKNIPKTNDISSKTKNLGTVNIFDGRREITVNILHLSEDVEWIFLQAVNESDTDIPYFDGHRHPYDVAKQNGDIALTLLRDSLFFGKAVTFAIPMIDPVASWILLLQDWEAATTSLFINAMGKDKYVFPIPYLTIHNSYDAYVPDDTLDMFGINPSTCPGGTVLQRALPLVQKTVFTVSEQFAIDLSSEILQSQILAPHLKSELSSRLTGINNGAFTKLSVPDEILASAKKKDYTHFQKWKIHHRENALKAIGDLTPSEDKPVWGDTGKFSRNNFPWIVMAGRDDSRQKGYDVACYAIEKYLSQSREACFLFFPIPGEEGLPGIKFLHDLADRYPENVLAFPFLFKEGYFEIMRGATYGLMPSLYEPFGMANEYFLNGASCIGRATGGIMQQVVPFRQVPSFSPSVEKRASRWHNQKTPATGFLYREEDNIPTKVDDWEVINAAFYDLPGHSPNRLQQRSQLALFQSMASALKSCLSDAIRLYVDHPQTYYKFLSDGIEYISRSFTWQKAAKTYQQLINQEIES